MIYWSVLLSGGYNFDIRHTPRLSVHLLFSDGGKPKLNFIEDINHNCLSIYSFLIKPLL